MAFLRLVLLLLVVQTVVYASVVMYLRAARRERIAAEWPDHGSDRERDAFVNARVAAYMNRARPRLVLAIYLVPTAVLAIYIYLSN